MKISSRRVIFKLILGIVFSNCVLRLFLHLSVSGVLFQKAVNPMKTTF